MHFKKLYLFRTDGDSRPRTPIVVNMETVQCLEPHGEGTKIQFTLGEPSLYVDESIAEIFSRTEIKLKAV